MYTAVAPVYQKSNKVKIYLNRLYIQLKMAVFLESKRGEKWRCIKRKCLAKIYTTDGIVLSARDSIQHDHEPLNEHEINRRIVNTACKRKAIGDISILIQKL